MATTSTFPLSRAARKTKRPISLLPQKKLDLQLLKDVIKAIFFIFYHR